MKLTGLEILKRRDTGEILIDPWDAHKLNPNSYNLSLDDKLVVYDTNPKVVERTDLDLAMRIWNDDRRLFAKRNGNGAVDSNRNTHIELGEWHDVLDMAQENQFYELVIPKAGLVLVPGRLYLAQTVEYTETRNLVPYIDGRSSIGRLGISIHATAGFGDVGFCGTWTLEIAVVEPVRIYPFVQFCQISYETVLGEVTEYQSTKGYQGQRMPKPSGIWKELQKQCTS